MKSLGSQVKTARQQRHMSQSQLARMVGCKQSALSMFEGGRMTALNAQVIGKVCAELGLLAPSAVELEETREVQVKVRSFCPNAGCPSNLPYTLGEVTVLLPRGHIAGEHEHHCAWCGEVLEKACPECGAVVNEGAYCAQCGHAYLVTEETPPNMAARQAQSAQLVAWTHL